jgi:inhibitor of cysteine peptidase
MKMSKLIFHCFLLITLILCTGCQSSNLITAGKEPTDIIRINSGEEFMITLDSNPTTGYQWQMARPLDNRLLKFMGTEYLASQKGLIGAGGKEQWSFQAIEKGKACIYLEYVRPWEKDAEPAIKKEFTIIIE